jgi:COP9 signalosome complex subunit 4
MALTRTRGTQEDDDAANADTFIKKAGFLLADSKDEALDLQYNVCYARILDSKARSAAGV